MDFCDHHSVSAQPLLRRSLKKTEMEREKNEKMMKKQTSPRRIKEKMMKKQTCPRRITAQRMEAVMGPRGQKKEHLTQLTLLTPSRMI